MREYYKSGSNLFRETQSDDLLERARTLFTDHFTSAVNFVPTSLLIVTWDNVGYFDRKSDKVSFTVLCRSFYCKLES